MEVGIDIYNWLKDCFVITEEIEASENGKYQIPEEKALLFENGLNFTPLLKRLNKVQNKLDRETTPMPEINSLQEVKSPASKLYN